MLKRSIRVALGLLACAQGIAQASSEVLGAMRVQQKAPAGEHLPCGAVPPGSVSYSRSVSLAALQACSSSRAGPWSATYSPDGSALYVPLFGGGIGADNCLVARLNAQTLAVQGTVAVGSGPEEIAFVTSSPGQIRYGFVTNSTGSSVSVFDAQHHAVATIPIPFDPLAPYQTAFPFGLAVAPDQSRVYVGTLDGSGVIHVIDVEQLALLPSAALRFGVRHGFGRLAFAGETLVVTATRFKSNFSGSTAKVIFVNPRRPIDSSSILLGSSSNSVTFPSAQDVGVLCDQTVFVAGFDLGAQVFVLDAGSRSLIGAIPTLTGEPLGKFQGLGVDGERMVAVADLWTGEIAFLDGLQRRHVGTLDSATLNDFHSQLNEIAFAPAGDRLIVPGLASDSLMVLDIP